MKIFKPLLLLALAISVVGLASAAPFEQRSQRFVGGEISGDLTLTGGGSILSTSAGDITIAPAAGGDTVIDGTSGDFIVNDVAKFAELITDTGSGATELGTVCANENGTGNVCMGEKLRVEGKAYFNSQVHLYNVSSWIHFFDGSRLVNEADLTGLSSGTKWGIGSSGAYGSGYNFLFTSASNAYKSHHCVNSTDPYVRIFSAADVDATSDRWGGFSHDGTTDTDGDMTIATGAGGIVLTPDDKYLIPPRILSNAPAEPVACGVGYDGAMVYVDDTDDTAYGRICVCANLDGTGYDWRDAGDIVGTACPFF